MILTVILVAGVFTSGDQEGGKNEVVTLKFNSLLSVMDPDYGYWSEFCNYIAETSKGTLDVDIYPTESLGRTIDMIGAISQGVPILQDCAPSHLSDCADDYRILCFKEKGI